MHTFFVLFVSGAHFTLSAPKGGEGETSTEQHLPEMCAYTSA